MLSVAGVRDKTGDFIPIHRIEVLPKELECLEDLLLRMLAYDPEERISVVEALEHPWLRGECI